MEKASTYSSFLFGERQNKIVYRRNAYHLKTTKFNNLKDDEVINQKDTEQFTGDISIMSKSKSTVKLKLPAYLNNYVL